jgi:hypothetical protein
LFLSPPQLLKPLERGVRLKLIGVFMKMDRGGLSLGQRERRRSCRRLQPLQVHPRGPHISAADSPATLLKTAPALFLPPRLYYRIKPHSGEGNEKIRQKPLRVLSPERFGLATAANRDCDPHIFQTPRIAIPAPDVAEDLKRMNVPAQAARLATKTELQDLYE